MESSPPSARPRLRIFVNYRREDTSGHAGRLYDALSSRFGDDDVFIDVDHLRPGDPFADVINAAVSSCDVLIALIGRSWLTATDERGRRRLDVPEDFVRLEIQAALERGVRVIPALVSGADPPASDELPESLSGLARRQAIELSDVRWRFDVDRLLDSLEKLAASLHAEQVKPDETERPPPTKPSLRLSRRRIVQIAAGLAAVAVAVVAAALLFRDDGSSAGAAGFPDAIEDELLLAHIPETIRDTCEAGRTPSAVFLRTVRCLQAPGGEAVEYSRAHSGDALRGFFLQQAADADVRFPTGGTCRDREAAAGEWVRARLIGHAERRSREAEGRVLCYVRGGRAVIAWTDTPTKTFSLASRPASDRSGLYGWWASEGGPGKQLHSGHETVDLGEYPDAIEDELLLVHLPTAIRETCERTENVQPDVFLRSVECRQEPSDGTVVYSYAHSGTAMRAHFVNHVQGEGMDDPTPETCQREAAAAGPWIVEGGVKIETRSSRGTGSVVCYAKDDKAWIEWTAVSQLIFGTASADPAERAQLYEWWRRSAGPVERSEHEGHSG